MKRLFMIILVCWFPNLSVWAQQSIDIKKMQARYERRMPMLDSMYNYPDQYLGKKYTSLKAKTTDDIDISGWLIKGKKGKGTVLMVHGFMMNKSHMLSRAKTFVEGGISVLLMDLRARGESGGKKTSTGKDSALDILAMASLYYQKHKRLGPLTFYGFSHGGRAVIHAAALSSNGERIILESTPYSLTNSFKRTFKIPDIPNMDGEGLNAALKAIEEIPILLLIGDVDTAITKEEAMQMVGFSEHSETTLEVFAETGHDVHADQNMNKYRAIVFPFLDVKK